MKPAHTQLHRIMPAECCTDLGIDDGPAVRMFGRRLLLGIAMILGALLLSAWAACESGAC